MGAAVRMTSEQKAEWFSKNLDIMRQCLRSKFYLTLDLACSLLDTRGKYLEETNYWGDTFWGVCDGVGENWMGKLLMEVRAEVEEDWDNERDHYFPSMKGVWFV